MFALTVTQRVLGITLCLSLVGATCGQGALGVLPGVVNNPRNLSLRRAILSYGTSQMCNEMQRRSIPMRLRDEDPALGRFYTTSCLVQELANENLLIQFGGHGYVWTNLTKRMTFDAGGAVEYDQDFLMDGDTMYVYFRQRSTTAATFTTKLIEQPAAVSIGNLPLAQGSNYANALGEQLVKAELSRGFTVIRESNGSVQFGLGVIEKGQRPQEPYRRSENGKIILVNERAEVHQNQRDFIGPIEVVDSDQALTFTIAIEGAPAIDALVVPRSTGDQWLYQYETQLGLTQPTSLPLLDEAIHAGVIWRRTRSLPKGLYYLVLDNTAFAGQTQPPANANDDRAALVSYAIELGDAP